MITITTTIITTTTTDYYQAHLGEQIASTSTNASMMESAMTGPVGIAVASLVRV